jgi:lipoprotein-anchoring transpeptidase ErfK/SrfK
MDAIGFTLKSILKDDRSMSPDHAGGFAMRNAPGLRKGRVVKQFFRIAAIMVSLIAGSISASAAQLVARVDVSSQTMTVSYRGAVIHTWKVSTGRKGYYTPRGTYSPQRLHARYFSRKYDNAPMPYSVFFRGGYAIHGTNHVKALGRPASHGCIRLQTGNAARFFKLVQQAGSKNTRIIITN